MKFVHRACGCLFQILAVGCAPDLEEAVMSGAHVDLYYPVDELPPCAGTVDWMSDVAERQGAYLGLPPVKRISYHMRPYGYEPWPCPGAADACASGETIWARSPEISHELVHALIAQHRLAPALFFEEGLAVALGQRGHSGLPDWEAPLALLLESAPVPSEELKLAGAVTSYLLQHDGAAAYVELLHSTRRDSGTEQTMAAFEEVYGRSLVDVLEEAADAPRPAANRLAFPKCARDPSPWDDDTWSSSKRMDCDLGAIGPLLRSYPPAMADYDLLDVPSTGEYDVEAIGDGGFVRIWRCVDDVRVVSLPLHLDEDGALTETVQLEAGRHYVRYDAYIDQPVDITLTVRPSVSEP